MAAVYGSLLVSAVTMYNFWAVPEDQQRDEMTQFLKNVVLAGGVIGLLAVAGTAWPYSLALTAF